MIISFLVLGTTVIKEERARRERFVARRPYYNYCCYLDSEAIMNLFVIGRYSESLEQEIQKTMTREFQSGLRAGVGQVEANVGKKVTEEEVSSFVSRSEPPTVIRLIIDTLERADPVVVVDLEKLRIALPAGRLPSVLRSRRDSLGSLRLSELSGYVWLTGWLRPGPGRSTSDGEEPAPAEEPTADDRKSPPSLFLLCGDEAESDRGPLVPLTCASEWLDGDAPKEPFRAQCFGKIEARPGTREPVMRPLAIFR
ncbi:hypothetical protein ACFYY8_22590 [Streptosporangium sp. NPDC001559]|uniref:hypothetical protein n=1 Tax=Streptosporangium sp. NPDC001559 TaxID=3366187 RepID=UPI0036E5180F